MTSIKGEIEALEEQLRQAELGPDKSFFEKHLDDAMLFVADGKTSQPKQHIVAAHDSATGKGQKFTRVEMSEMVIIEHENAAVVTCTGTYEGPQGKHVLRFLRVWAKKADGWKIIAGSMLQ